MKPYILYKKANQPVTLHSHSPNSDVESNEGLLNMSAEPAHNEHGDHEVYDSNNF